jgi:hypothetical protein
MRFHRRTYAKTVLRAGLLGALVVSSCASSFAAPNVDALIQTPFLNELTSYDAAQINNPLFFGFDANFVAPLNITNLLPQNGIVSIADAGARFTDLSGPPGSTNLQRITGPRSTIWISLASTPISSRRSTSPTCCRKTAIISIAASGSTV